MTATSTKSPVLSGSSRAAQDKFYAGLEQSETHFWALLEQFQPGDRVLELRCGTESVVRGLTARGVEVTSLDSGETLPFDNGTFDGVVGIGSLYRLDMIRTFGEAARVLRSDGRAVFIEPLGHNPAINSYRRRTPEARQAYTHPLRCEDLVLASQFFIDVDVETFHLFGSLTSGLATSRTGRLLHRLVTKVDRAMIRLVPRLRWHAWIAVAELRSPR